MAVGGAGSIFAEVVMLIEIVLPVNGSCFLLCDNSAGGNGLGCSKAET